MKRILTFLAATFLGSAWAATPVAVWDGFTNLAPAEGYALEAGDGVVGDDGVATIAAGKALKLTKDMGTAFTVVMEVSDIPGAPGGSFSTLLDAFYSNGAAHLSLDSQEGALLVKWNHGKTYGSAADRTPISGRHLIALSYDRTSERVYVNGEMVLSGAAGSSSVAVNRFCIGGYWGESPTCTANGMKVYRLALYSTALADDDIAAIRSARSVQTGDTYVCSNLDRAETKSSHYTQGADAAFMLPPSADCPAGTVVGVTVVKLGSPPGKSMADSVTLAGQKGAALPSATEGFASVQPYTFATPVEIEVGRPYVFNAGGSQCTGIRGQSPIAGVSMGGLGIYCAVEGTVRAVVRRGAVSKSGSLATVSWENGEPQDGDLVRLTVAKDATLTLGSSRSFREFGVSGPGALAIDDLGNLGATPVVGNGILVVDKADATIEGDASSGAHDWGIAGLTDAQKWTGTLWLRNAEWKSFHFATLGNASSTVRLTNVKGYSPSSHALAFDGTLELVDDGEKKALTVNDSFVSTYKVKSLAGTGTFASVGGQVSKAHYVFETSAAFEGVIDLSGNATRCVTLGAYSGATPFDDADRGFVVIPGGSTAHMSASKTWAFAGGKGVKGAGRLVVEGEAPAEFTVDPAVTLDSSWTGTVELKNLVKRKDANYGVLLLNKYGNANATVALNNVTMTAYAVKGSNNGATDENDVGAYEVMEGGWNLRHGDFSSTDVYRGDLKGTGTITVTATGGRHGQIVFCGNPGGFTGRVVHGSQLAKAKRVVFLDGRTAEPPANSTDYRTVFFGQGVALPPLGTASPVKFADTVAVNVEEVPPPLSGTKVLWNEAAEEAMLDVRVTAVVGGVESDGYALYQRRDGIYLVMPDSAEWIGPSGTALDAADAWADGRKYDDSAQNGVFEFPVNGAGRVVTVKPGTPAAGVFLFKGVYTLRGGGEKVELGLNSLLIPAGGSLTLENMTLKVPTLANEALAHVTFGKGGRLALEKVPVWNTTAAINVADVSELTAGAHELVSWTERQKAGSKGYGRPTLPTAFAGLKDGWEAKLVFQAHRVVMLLRDPAWLARKPLTIWPLGDSITEGMNASQTRANYRVQLYQKLQLLGYNVKSVGFSVRTYGARGAFDPSGEDVGSAEDWIHHSGVGGELACHYTSNHGTLHGSWSNALDQAGDPDIVLLHIGINDIVNGKENAAKRWRETYGSVTNLAANILRERPHAKIVLSSMHRLEWGQNFQKGRDDDRDGNKNYVQPFRDEMAALMEKVNAGEIAALPKGRVFFADMYDRVRPRSYAVFQAGENEEDGLFEGDHIHPNWEGHDRMSDVWLEQVRKAFPDPGDTAAYRSNVTPARVPAKRLGAANNVPSEYLKGFRKARVIAPNDDGRERANTVRVAKTPGIADDAKVERVGYYAEYVFPSAATNIHRWVWVDMNAFHDGMTVAEAGLPTDKTIQKVVDGLHVASNHRAVHTVGADEDGVRGFVEFSPFAFGGTGSPVADGPKHWMDDTSWNDAFMTSGGYGSMQVHRMNPGENPFDPSSPPPAEVLFAYNAWNAGDDGKATEFGIGDFNQHYQRKTIDWVYMRETETMHAGCLDAKSIEIWVKGAYVDVKVTEDDATHQPVLSVTGAPALTEVTVTISAAGGEPFVFTGRTDADGAAAVPLSGSATLRPNTGYAYAVTTGTGGAAEVVGEGAFFTAGDVAGVCEGYVGRDGDAALPIRVSDDFAAALGSDKAVVQAKLNETPVEGALKVWQAYAVGAKAAAAKEGVLPVVSGKETGEVDTLKLVDGWTPRTDSGVKVTRKVKAGSSLDALKEVEPKSSDAEGVTIALPTNGPGASYLKVEYTFE